MLFKMDPDQCMTFSLFHMCFPPVWKLVLNLVVKVTIKHWSLNVLRCIFNIITAIHLYVLTSGTWLDQMSINFTNPLVHMFI